MNALAYSSRRLTTASVPSSRRLGIVVEERVPAVRQTPVSVVYGLWAPSWTPVIGKTPVPWRFDPSFEPEDPWAQRAMMSMCNVPDRLRVAKASCWIVLFKIWLQERTRQFPSRSFDKDVVEWYPTTDKTADLWIVDGKLRACSLDFMGDVDKNLPAGKVLEYKAKWDTYVAEMNTQASLSASTAWATSEGWQGAEAARTVVASTVETILTECTVSWVGLTFFTGDPVLASMVLSLMIANTVWLTSVMTFFLHWTIGPVEIIFLVMFLGYSVTFGLHMAFNYAVVGNETPELHHLHNWVKRRRALRGARLGGVAKKFEVDAVPHGNHDSNDDVPLEGRELREARARLAVHRVGLAEVLSTISTLGSAVFLLVCRLEFFFRLGVVVIVIVVLSAITSVTVFPALLVLFGPGPDPCYKRLPRQAFAAICGSFKRPSRDGYAQDAPLLDR